MDYVELLYKLPNPATVNGEALISLNDALWVVEQLLDDAQNNWNRQDKPLFTWDIKDDKKLSACETYLDAYRSFLVEAGEAPVAEDVKKCMDFIQLIRHRLTECGMRPITQWYDNYKDVDKI